MEIKKAKPEQIDEIIQLLNQVYREESPEFDIQKEQPKIYCDPFLNHADEHFIAIDQGKIVGVAGNILAPFTFQNTSNCVSFVGSIAVLPEYRNKGIMAQLMHAIEKENLEQNVTFSMLCGRRSRFLHFGYEKGPYNHFYHIDRYLLDHQVNRVGVTIREMTEDEFDHCFEKYLNFTTIPTRKKRDFIRALQTWNSIPYVVYDGERFAGYFSFCPQKHQVTVMNVDDICVFSAFELLFQEFNISELNVVISPLDKERNKLLSSVADGVNIVQDISLKVYDWVKFFKILFHYNNFEFDNDTDIIFEIDHCRYEIDIEYPYVGVWKTHHHKPDVIISSTGIIPYLFSPLSHRNASFLPVYFAIPYPDLF